MDRPFPVLEDLALASMVWNVAALRCLETLLSSVSHFWGSQLLDTSSKSTLYHISRSCLSFATSASSLTPLLSPRYQECVGSTDAAGHASRDERESGHFSTMKRLYLLFHASLSFSA